MNTTQPPRQENNTTPPREPTPKDLLRKLAGKKVALSTRCGTFKETTGVIKEVFDKFFLFVTVDDRFVDLPPQRHWIFMENVGVISEETKVGEEIPITRYEI